jgi:quercetin dioxygenase-like cupin family protein
MNQPSGSERGRTHPDERFAPPAQAFDLVSAARELSSEANTGGHGHRQKTLYRYGNTTLAFFLFDAGARMREHRAAGTVFIQVLQGRLSVQAQDERHDLEAGQVLVMSPNVSHDLYAEQASQMLLTVSLVGPEQS